MANPLTGGFEAAVQVAVRQVDDLLATLHQNGAGTDAPLKLLHSVRARIGDPRRRRPDLAAFGDWELEFQQAIPAAPRPPLRDLLVATSPPGVASRFTSTFQELDDLVLEPASPEVVRGTVTLQISTVRVGVASGATAEVTIRADLRALYDPDPGTAPLPAAFAGEMRAVYEIRRAVVGGKSRLLIRPSPHDEKIEFIPSAASGVGSTDALRIAAQLRKALREGMVLLPVELPDRFPFTDFKGVGSGAGAAFALPLQLTGAPAPPGGSQGINQSFLGTSGFGFAVSEEHVQSLIDLDAIRAAIQQRRIVFHVSVLGFSGSVTYRLRFSSGPTLDFLVGAIEISGRVEVETSTWWAPNGFVSFRQRVTLQLNAATGQVTLTALGEPSVDESWFIPHGRAVSIVKEQVTSAVSANGPAVRQVFQDARAKLVGALQAFEASATATYAQVEVTPDGVVVRGEITSAARIPPEVRIGEADHRRAFTAFESWVPGGRIDRFLWSWVEYPPQRPFAWSGVLRTLTESHRFQIEKPPAATEIGQVCLQMIGRRVRRDGSTETVVAGRVCEINEPVLTLDVPSWWEPVMLPVWMPDLPEGARLRDSIVAHVAVQTDRPRDEPAQNVLVFFPDWRSGAPFDALVRGLQAARPGPPWVSVLVVLPDGSFDSTRREVEAGLVAFPRSLAPRVLVAEDTSGGWSRTFGADEAPAAFLVNARREFVWKAAGDLDPAAIADALDTLAVPCPPPRFRPLRLRLAAGARVPAYFRDDGGNDGALHRLRGRPLSVVFWQSWSAPCLAELRRLQAELAADGRGGRQVVAFHGGADSSGFESIRKQLGLTFPLVQDTEHRVARTFGVRCWPTTVAIGAGGLIEQVQLGVGLDRDRLDNEQATLRAAEWNPS